MTFFCSISCFVCVLRPTRPLCEGEKVLCACMRVRWTIFERPTIYSSCLSNHRLSNPPKMLGINRGRQGKVGPLSGDGPNAAFFFLQSSTVIVCLITQLSILTTLFI